MPVLLKGHTWSQDLDHVTVRVPFPENHLRQEDIFTSERLLKINKAPYYWEALLSEPIVEEASRCSLLENEIVFILRKQEPGLEWGQLELNVAKAEKVRIKEDLLASHQKHLEEKSKQRAVAKDQQKKDEISKQIERDANSRTEIEQLLEESKRREMNRMEQRQRNSPRPKESMKPITKPTAQPKKVEQVPGVRSSGTVAVTFTKRNFITPQRESREHEEQEWIIKQAAAKKAVGFVDDDLRPEERNPEWLKEKGDSFFQQKNYLAAVSAYSAGIRLTKKYYSLFLNRSAAQFALENYQRCAEDCSAALELLDPPIEANRRPRVACLARRGAALTKLGYLQQGYEEMVAASQLDPQNEGLRREAEMIQRKLEECDSDSD